ncbi:MAG: type I-U CRISPR-associated protein Cas5/Cas6 [Planctomycetota bacterium]|nr:type I-U CRISPR-associated protein Cas5/Cas6 [Planctomycetota bacterium]
MLHLEARFLSGRYHATPWGRHVNEGAVEWPPSPWRLFRAMLSAGFGRLGWTDVPREAAVLLDALAAAPPSYRLPEASMGHTRHFMPPFKGNTDKVIDAFAWVGPDAPLGIDWPVELPADAVALLDEVLEAMPYLGRAESWVEVRRVEAPSTNEMSTLVQPGAAPPGGEAVRVSLLAPLSREELVAWRAGALAERERAVLADEQAKAEAKGKKAPVKLTPARLKKLEAELPGSIVEVLRADTSELQRAGWSQPPGTRRLDYWIPTDALDARSSRTSPQRSPEPPKHEGALLSLWPDTEKARALPMVSEALSLGEALHGAFVSAASKLPGNVAAPSELIGRSPSGVASGHKHARVMPIDLDEDGRLDHVLVTAAGGLSEATLAALVRVSRAYAQDLPAMLVTVVGAGRLEDLCRVGGAGRRLPQLATSTVWRSVTPFVPPRHLKAKGKNSLEGQVRAELESHGVQGRLERLEVEVEVGAEGWAWADVGQLRLGRASRSSVLMTQGAAESALQGDLAILRPHPRWRRHRMARRDEAKAPPQRVAFGLRMRFAHPVKGPLALGYGSHLGLGQMVPEST